MNNETKNKITNILVEEILNIEKKSLKEVKIKSSSEMCAEIVNKVNEVFENEDQKDSNGKF